MWAPLCADAIRSCVVDYYLLLLTPSIRPPLLQHHTALLPTTDAHRGPLHYTFLIRSTRYLLTRRRKSHVKKVKQLFFRFLLTPTARVETSLAPPTPSSYTSHPTSPDPGKICASSSFAQFLRLQDATRGGHHQIATLDSPSGIVAYTLHLIRALDQRSSCPPVIPPASTASCYCRGIGSFQVISESGARQRQERGHNQRSVTITKQN